MTTKMESFRDEFLKIAVSREAARHTKTRQGRRPVRVDTMLKNAGILDLFRAKPAAPPPSLASKLTAFLGSAKAPFVTGAAAGAGGLYLGKRALDKYRIGSRYLEAQEQARG